VASSGCRKRPAFFPAECRYGWIRFGYDTDTLRLGYLDTIRYAPPIRGVRNVTRNLRIWPFMA
jgi:hypothetical protein